MEIVTLEFQGIGPFTDRHFIDFRQMGRGGLFLLEGPTGSGKTTILDAIVFALYGDVAGVDSSKARIVSSLLRPDREPFVELVIDSRRGLLRVRRTPEFERPKLRGNGTTTSKASIKLWKLSSPDDAGGTPVSTSIAEADQELRQAIGLTKPQFTQTVLLPQGSFATFLRAKPEDRRAVLQDIFGTELYQRFADQLAAQAKAHRGQMDLVCQSVYEVASNFCQVAWYEDALEASEPIGEQVAFDNARDAMDLDALLEGARKRRAALADQLTEADLSVQATRAVHQAADDALRALEHRNRLIEERTALLRSREALRARESEVGRDEARLAAAERAEHIRRPVANHEQATGAHEKACAVLQGEVERVRLGGDADLVSVALSPDLLRSQAASARLEASPLDRLVDLEKGLTERAKALTRQRASQLGEGRRITEGLLLVEESRVQALALGQRLTECQTVAATLATAVEERSAALLRRDAARDVDRLAALLGAARAAELDLSAAHAQAVERHREARIAWLGSLAGELAAELVEGQPCAVCGSPAHPSPATQAAGFVSRDEVQHLAEAMAQAARQAADAQSLSDRLAGQLEQQAALAGGLTLPEAETDLIAADTRRAQAEQASHEVATLRDEIDALTTQAQQTERSLLEARSDLATRNGQLQETERQLVSDQTEVAAQAEGFMSVHERVVMLLARSVQAQSLANLVQCVVDSEAELHRCSSDLTAVLAERGFATIEAANAALMSDAERAKVAEAVTGHRKKVASVADQLAGERLVGVADAIWQDPTPARLAQRLADEAQRGAQTHVGLIQGTVNAVSQASEDLRERIATLQRLRDEAGPLLRMAALANAQDGNLQRVTLPTYVLLRRFEEVVDLANVRLDAMTGGRYELRRTDEAEGRSRKLGLGLEIVDHQARDQARDPKTLSGGETFMASLALALGLADAVTAEAGGIELHTLFVDEGFGSLDPETLDAVMRQLSALRDGGRSVGVVSHVAEMKLRIAERISVAPRGDGTSTLTCSTDA